MTKDQTFEGYLISKDIDQLNEFLEVLSKAISIKIELDYEKHAVSTGRNGPTYCFRPVDTEFDKVKNDIKEILSSKLEDFNNRLEEL